MNAVASTAVQQRKELCSTDALLDALKECSKTRNLQRGKQLHAEAAECGRDSSIDVANALMNMYSKSGSMADARRIFDNLKHPNVVSWTVLILGYADNGQGLAALDLFRRMENCGMALDSVTFVAALKACASIAVKGSWAECRKRGKEVHELAVSHGYDSDIYVQSTLIDMYAKCGSIEDARQVFDSMKQRSVVSWNALILGYAANGQSLKALHLLRMMKDSNIAPTSVTLVASLKACASLAAENKSTECTKIGRILLDLGVENGYASDMKFQNTLIDTFSKCGSTVDAHQIFAAMRHPDVVSWNVVIMGYADNGKGLTALNLFRRMRSEGVSPGSVTFVAVLKACISIALNGGSSEWPECRNWAKEVHNLLVENGSESDAFLQCTLIDMYAKCGSMQDARRVFDTMKHPDVVCWTVLIQGYADNGQGLTALDLFTRMKTGGTAPNPVTFAAVFKACGLVGGLEFGRAIHSQLKSTDFDAVLVTCLVDFYAKCGSLVEARSVFDVHPGSRNVITWTALMAGFSSCGDHESVFKLFERMQETGLVPDSVTFLCVLNCCSHAGLVEKGKQCFEEMSSKYGIVPCVERYTCMVDVLARSNKLEDALALLQRMPWTPDDVTWTTILDSCRKWKNVEMARLAFQSLVYLNDRDASGYVLMGQIYGSRGMLQEQEMVMNMRRTIRKM